MDKYDIFLSYRRKGGWEMAKHLYDLLTRDGYSVSFDIDNLRKGLFDEELLKRIDECTDFIVILDKHVFDRIFDKSFPKKNDWLRMELAHAIKQNKNIIPIMLEGFKVFPEYLPDDISKVQRFNGPIYNKYFFDNFYDRLKKDFIKSLPTQTIPSANSFIKILTDTVCRVLIDLEDKGIALPNQIMRIPLCPGSYHLRFESILNKNICQEEPKYCIKAGVEEIINVELDELVNMSIINIYNKGHKYYYGDGLPKDEKKAVLLYKIAANGGCVEAMNSLGYCYDKGTGIERNLKKAIFWYKEAATKGNIKAMWNIGNCYQESEIKDYKSAIKWYKEAAKKGHTKSINTLGDLFYFGEGVAQDFSNAVNWYKKAAATGNDHSIERLIYCYNYGCGVDINQMVANKLKEALEIAKTGETEHAIEMVKEALK